MTVQQDVLARAASRIGYYAPNDPQPGSEAGRYWANKVNQAWLAGPSNTIWWCMLFVSMCLDEIGQIDSIGGFSYNTDVTLNRNRGRLVPVSAAQPGDVVIFNWGFTGGTDHVGFVERNLGGGRLQTIEGNTSSGAAGSQSSGNGVWRRIRSSDIAAVIRPAYSGVTVTPVVAQTRVDSGLLNTDGVWGPLTTRKAQKILGTPVDGVISSQDAGNRQYVPAAGDGWVWLSRGAEGSQLIQALQRATGAGADGFFGPNSAKALQGRLGVAQDGYVGKDTVTAFQNKLNTGSL